MYIKRGLETYFAYILAQNAIFDRKSNLGVNIFIVQVFEWAVQHANANATNLSPLNLSAGKPTS